MKDILKVIIADSHSRKFPDIWERTIKIPINSGKIITLIGVRRSGKTYQLFDIIRKLRSRGVSVEKILYLNFEDERLNMNSNNLDLILESYRELYPELKLSECYFFFDEIQEAEGWEKFISRMFSTISTNIFITGSNSKMLSKEIATILRGRTLSFEIFPLSFREFVGITYPKINQTGSEGKAKIANLFSRFMVQGGFPELVGLEKRFKDKLLQEYFNVMLFRDLVERYDIAQTSVLKYFCKRMIASSAGEFSAHKIYNELKSQGYQIGKDTLYSYLSHIESIYMNRFVMKYSHSVVKSESAQRKTYVIDQGMGISLDHKFSQDKGRILETTVALELIKSGKQIFYTQEGGDCDFLVVKKGKVIEAIQVCFDVSDDQTKKRETNGLINACKKFELKSGVIISFDESEKFTADNVKIEIVPAWKYFIN